MRRDGQPFAEPEGVRIAALAPHLASAFRDAALTNAVSSRPATTGVAILRADGQLDSVTPAGRELVDRLPTRPGVTTPGALRVLAIAVQAHVPARVRVPGRDGGWVYLQAEPLSDRGGRIAVALQPAGHAELSPIVLRAHGLTARETEVTLRVLRGESNRQIADRLQISPWTVKDHLKAIFAKVGVRSRRDLALQIYVPPRPANANPARRRSDRVTSGILRRTPPAHSR